ncbi:MAG: membrane protein insertase YidC, partial [Flavobacteriales bacterium]|nr:membrane protein insertase YidC [Flavobacteriales bacterium]
MEEKKFDPYQFIGFVLIAVILTWMLYQNQPQEVPQNATVTPTEVVANKTAVAPVVNDSLAQLVLQNTYGDLAVLMQESPQSIQTLSSEKLLLEVDSKGGQLVKVQLKEFENYQSAPLNLIAEGNTDFNIEIPLRDGRILNTRDFYFTPSLSKQGDQEIVTLTSGAASGIRLMIDYIIQPDTYLIDYQVRSEGLGRFVKTEGVKLQWRSQAFR